VELFDSHVHLDDEAFAADLAAVIDRARQAGVIGMVTVGIDVASSRAAVDLAGRFSDVHAAVAVHPHEAARAGPEAMADLWALATHSNVVAVGETGLDYAKDYAPREIQRRVFIEHIRLSRERNIPLIVHCREAHSEVLEILEREPPAGVVMHAFSGSADVARACVERGYFISLAGPVTFRNARAAAQVAQEVPLGSLLVETDAPVLAPEPFRGRRNEPAYLRHIVQRIADLRGRPPEEIAAATTLTARRVFRIRAEIDASGTTHVDTQH